MMTAGHWLLFVCEFVGALETHSVRQLRFEKLEDENLHQMFCHMVGRKQNHG
jgi:hypothetical protein